MPKSTPVDAEAETHPPPAAAMLEACPDVPVGYHDVISVNGRMRQLRAVPWLIGAACFPAGFTAEGKHAAGTSVEIDGFAFEQLEGAYFLRIWLDIARRNFPGLLWRVDEIGAHPIDVARGNGAVCTVAYGCIDGRTVAAVAEALP